MMERLLGELIGLARATDGNEHLINSDATAVIVECLTVSDLSEEKLEELLGRIETEKRRMIPDCFACAAPCGKNNAYDMASLQQEDPRSRTAKLQLLAGIQEMAAKGCPAKATERFFYKALIVVGMDGFGPEFPESVVREMQTL